MLSCNPVTINSITYIGAIAVFTAVYFIPMPKLPYPIQDSMVQPRIHPSESIKYLILALWNFHFMRRSIEVFFVHVYNRKMPLIECIGAPVYYWVFALFIAWSVNGDSYVITFIPLLIPGTILFFLGEFGNAWYHLKLRFLKTKKPEDCLISPDTGHILPHGGFFNIVSCPHYLFEIISWLGFSLVTWTLAALLFLVCTMITLGIYARKKHHGYIMEFDGKNNRPLYPRSRKALIPFVF